MAKKTSDTRCRCGGRWIVIDHSQGSSTEVCNKCERVFLCITFPRETAILLENFAYVRGVVPNQQPIPILTVTEELVDCLKHNQMPDFQAVIYFGIDSPERYWALQYAVSRGITAYQLDRVGGDGEAITSLLRQLPDNPYEHIWFRIKYDPWEGPSNQ